MPERSEADTGRHQPSRAGWPAAGQDARRWGALLSLADPWQAGRTLRVPDDLRVLRSLRAPESGPRIVFFSGGSALRPLCRALKRYTHNSVHFITTFDSGGSSARLRCAFGMPALGDLRNRILALADEDMHGNQQIYRLFSHRLPATASREELAGELAEIAFGRSELVRSVPQPMQRIVEGYLRYFQERMPPDFDLRGANLGNLLLAGSFLRHSRDLPSVLALFSQLLEVRGCVRPIVDADLHLCAELANQERILGQHRLTGKEAEPIRSSVREIYLVEALDAPKQASACIEAAVERSIASADLVCYPMGSFYSSVVANLLPRGVGRAIACARGPRVYVPNTGHDPEQFGMTLADSVEALVRYVRADAGPDLPVGRIVNLVLLDRNPKNYRMQLDLERLHRMGVPCVCLDLVTEAQPHADPRRLAEALLSLT